MKKINNDDERLLIAATLKEVAVLIEFVEREQPVLTATKGVFSKKTLFYLNERLLYQKNIDVPNYEQHAYPVIDLMFSIVLDGGLYIKGSNQKGKRVLVKTEMLEKYKALNEYERYAFLLQTYWTKFNFKDALHSVFDIQVLNNFFGMLAKTTAGEKMVRGERLREHVMFSQMGAVFFHHWRFWGWGDLKWIEAAQHKDDNVIKEFRPNGFGVRAAKFLMRDAYSLWNVEREVIFSLAEKTNSKLDKKNTQTNLVMNILEETMLTLKTKQKETKSGTSFTVFKKLFPGNVFVKTVTEEVCENTEANYEFKISLTKKIWRKVRIAGRSTLADLHLAIQEAFSFNNDHLYAFFINGSRRTGRPIYCEAMDNFESESGKTAEETVIASLELHIGTKICYLFDFGDEWEFKIELMSIEDSTPFLLKAIVTEVKGKAPAQYPGCDEE